jgi:hypothetical protein
MPEPEEPTTPTTPVQTEPIVPASTVETPPWGEEENFDAARAWALIQNLKGDKSKTQAERDELAARIKAEEDAALSEQEKVKRELAETRKALADARRAKALGDYDLPESALVFLTAESAEDIEAQASALAGLTPKKEPDAPKAPADSRVKPALPNGNTNTPEPFDPEAIARKARGGR